MTQLKTLGTDVRTMTWEDKFLDTFPAPAVVEVTMTSDEFTAVCPITGQPDLYTVEIIYRPHEKCIESKSLKLYLTTFRNQGMFVEALAEYIIKDIVRYAKPYSAAVTLTQKSRGGITIKAVATA